MQSARRNISKFYCSIIIGAIMICIPSCKSVNSNKAKTIDLGNGYWFIQDAYSSDISHYANPLKHDIGTSVVPPCVIKFAWNDSFIAAISSSVFPKRVKYYFVVDKNISLSPITLDTINDYLIYNKMPCLYGPMDSIEFYSFTSIHKLELINGFSLIPRTPSP
jgi:hypothetical protein